MAQIQSKVEAVIIKKTTVIQTFVQNHMEVF